MGTLKRAWWLALAVPALLGVAALASADDGWEARLLRQVEQLESKLKDLGEPLPPTGSIEDRVRAIEGATAKLEKRRGVDPKPETYYEGSSESQRLVSLTNAVVSLRRRLDALPNGEPGQGGGASAGGEEESSASRLEFQVVAGLWGDQTAAEQAAQFVKSLDHERLTLFVASVQREAQRGPPDEYLADEARRSQVASGRCSGTASGPGSRRPTRRRSSPATGGTC